jgi:hypothetical protein
MSTIEGEVKSGVDQMSGEENGADCAINDQANTGDVSTVTGTEGTGTGDAIAGESSQSVVESSVVVDGSAPTTESANGTSNESTGELSISTNVEGGERPLSTVVTAHTESNGGGEQAVMERGEGSHESVNGSESVDAGLTGVDSSSPVNGASGGGGELIGGGGGGDSSSTETNAVGCVVSEGNICSKEQEGGDGVMEVEVSAVNAEKMAQVRYLLGKLESDHVKRPRSDAVKDEVVELKTTQPLEEEEEDGSSEVVTCQAD